MSPETATLDIGDTQQFTLTGDGDPDLVEWIVEPASGIVSVDQNGLVTALASGSVVLRAGGYEAHIQVKLPAPTLDEAQTTIAVVDGDVVVQVKAEGEELYSLEIDHNAQSVLPEFTIYADADNVWGDPTSESQAADAGVTASFDNGLWTLTLLENGAALNAWKTQLGGEIKFYLVVRNTEQSASGSMNDGSYHRLEITVAP